MFCAAATFPVGFHGVVVGNFFIHYVSVELGGQGLVSELDQVAVEVALTNSTAK